MSRTSSRAASRVAAPFAAFFLVSLAFVAPIPAARAQMDPALQLALGNPDKSTADPADHRRYLIRRPQFALSYSDALRFPNWVSWHLGARDIGRAQRGKFAPDTALPAGFKVVTPSDYTGSGYDRGHNCPSADRSDNRADNDAVFVMTNITPQAHGLNAGPWEKLESYCRTLARRGDDLFLVCGHGFSGPSHRTVGRGAIAVPDFAWKIVVVVPPGPGAAVARIDAATRVIAVRMPNSDSVSGDTWRKYIVSVAAIEKATGLRFFSALPPPVAAALKTKVDSGRETPARRSAPVAQPPSVTSAPPLPTTAGGAPPAPNLPAPDGKVWVNTRSGVYWTPGTEYYGKTKRGKYMTEQEAVKAGYRPAQRPQ